MRRLELLIKEVRRATENENASTTSGITDEELANYFNDAQTRLQARITAQHPRMFLAQSLISLVASTEVYGLPADIFLGSRIELLEWKFGSGTNDYEGIAHKALHERDTSYTSAGPYFYIRRDDDILINPVPSAALTDGLRLTYQKKLRDVDIRRGKIASAAKTGNVLDTITLSDPTTLLNKDKELKTASDAVLQSIDYICVVDKDGVSVLDQIPIDDYNKTTRVITVSASFSTTVAAATFVGAYVVGGKVATSHSDLKDVCERYLVSYVTFKVLRRDSNIQESEFQRDELIALESDIINAYQVPEEDPLELPLDNEWVQ